MPADFPLLEYQAHLVAMQESLRAELLPLEPHIKARWGGPDPDDNVFAVFAYECTRHTGWGPRPRDAVKQWSPKQHFLHPPAIRSVITLLLHVAGRMQETAVDAEQPHPTLPPEMWSMVFTFIPGSAAKPKTNAEIAMDQLRAWFVDETESDVTSELDRGLAALTRIAHPEGLYVHNWTILWDPTVGEDNTDLHSRCSLTGHGGHRAFTAFQRLAMKAQCRFQQFGFVLMGGYYEY